MAVVGVAPCQLFSPGGNQTTSPARISSIGPPQRCARPQPAVTIRIWPSGWECHADRAPGSNVTMAPRARAGAVALYLLVNGRPVRDRALARAVAQASEIVFSIVTDANAVRAVALGPDGIVSGLAPGRIYLDMSTIDPDASRAVAVEFHKSGAFMLDAPISGSPVTVKAGQASVMVGGSPWCLAITGFGQALASLV